MSDKWLKGYLPNKTFYLPSDMRENLQALGLRKHNFDPVGTYARKIYDSFEQSFFLLVHTAYLQAHQDVNKRTARGSANIPLIKNNFAPLSFNDIQQDDYKSAVLCVYEQNDIRPLADLYHSTTSCFKAYYC